MTLERRIQNEVVLVYAKTFEGKNTRTTKDEKYQVLVCFNSDRAIIVAFQIPRKKSTNIKELILFRILITLGRFEDTFGKGT